MKEFDYSDVSKLYEKVISVRLTESNLIHEIDEFIVSYLTSKALDYIKSTPSEFRKNNPLKLPSKVWEEGVMVDIKSICLQLLKGIGFEEKHPLTNVSVSSVYKSMEMFHFEFVKRKTDYTDLKQDMITFKHFMGLGEIKLFSSLNTFKNA